MSEEKRNDPVHHPSHYTDGKYECKDYIQCKGYGFELANAVKYITRAGKKSPGKEIEDLNKAIQYLEFYREGLRSDMGHISTLDYCEDKRLPCILSSAMMHIQDAHVAADKYKEFYIFLAEACIESYIDGLYDTEEILASMTVDEMIGNRTE